MAETKKYISDIHMEDYTACYEDKLVTVDSFVLMVAGKRSH